MDKYFCILVICTILRGFEGKFHPKIIEDEQMIVAFKCGHPNVYFMDGLWKKDKGFVCPKNSNEILNYCKHVYPDVAIENIMETVSDKVVPSWCQKEDKPCLDSFVGVVPYKCLAGKFQNEALLVPAPCIFDHLHDSAQCMTARSWSEMAGKSCKGRGLVLHKSSMLKPCGLNKYTGVEFVCCPSSFEAGSLVVTAQQAENKTKKEATQVEPHKLEQHTDGVVSSRAKIVEAYLNREEWRNEKPMTEHDFYLKAKKDLSKHHKEKVNEMINDWNSARSRAMQLEEVNKKEGEKLKKQLSERFQKLYEAEEVENEMEKKQLSDLHQQRVTADLNDRKQKALNHYLDTIDEGKPELGEIAKALKHLIKVLHKDRLHAVNRFKHLADTDPARADTVRESSANHVSELDRQLEEAVSLLDRVPKFREKIRNLIADHMDSYHSVDASVFVVIEDEFKELPRVVPEVTPAKVMEDDYILDVGNADKNEDDDDYFKVVEDDKHENSDGSFPSEDGKAGGFFKIDPDDVKKFKHGESLDSDEHGYKDEATMKSESKSEQSTKLPGRDRQQIVNLSGTVSKQKSESDQVVSSDEDEDRSEDLKEMEVVSSIDGDIYDRHFFQNPDHMHKSGLSVEQAPKYLKHSPTSIPGPNFGAAIPLGVAVGTLTVAVVIAIGVLVMRRRGGAGGLYHSPSVDAPAGAPQNGSPEERHVANMQINGYENPTYKYFERCQPSPTDA